MDVVKTDEISSGEDHKKQASADPVNSPGDRWVDRALLQTVENSALPNRTKRKMSESGSESDTDAEGEDAGEDDSHIEEAVTRRRNPPRRAASRAPPSPTKSHPKKRSKTTGSPKGKQK